MADEFFRCTVSATTLFRANAGCQAKIAGAKAAFDSPRPYWIQKVRRNWTAARGILPLKSVTTPRNCASAASSSSTISCARTSGSDRLSDSSGFRHRARKYSGWLVTVRSKVQKIQNVPFSLFAWLLHMLVFICTGRRPNKSQLMPDPVLPVPQRLIGGPSLVIQASRTRSPTGQPHNELRSNSFGLGRSFALIDGPIPDIHLRLEARGYYSSTLMRSKHRV